MFVYMLNEQSVKMSVAHYLHRCSSRYSHDKNVNAAVHFIRIIVDVLHYSRVYLARMEE